jgi:hypothetical protein
MRSILDAAKPVCAAFGTPDVLNSLYFCSYTEILQPLPANYMQVNFAAVGLSCKDSAVVTARDSRRATLSSEYADTVTSAGTNLTALSVGDLIFGLTKGNLGNYERVPAVFAQNLGLRMT